MLDPLHLNRYSAPVPHWIGKCLCLLAALGVLDGHLALAQSWAWLTMLQDRTPEQSLSGAIESTFSGDAPCPMCCAIQKERQKKEQESPLPELKPTAKFPPTMLGHSVALSPRAKLHIGLPIYLTGNSPSRYERPPSPPPRARARSLRS